MVAKSEQDWDVHISNRCHKAVELFPLVAAAGGENGISQMDKQIYILTTNVLKNELGLSGISFSNEYDVFECRSLLGITQHCKCPPGMT